MQGASIHSKDKKKLMPLHCACWKGQLEAVEFLLSHGAQTCECDVSLKTALHWAVQYDHFNVLHTLLKVSSSVVLLAVYLIYFQLLNVFIVRILLALNGCLLNIVCQNASL